MKTMRSCSIVIPTVNEEKNIPVLLNRIEREEGASPVVREARAKTSGLNLFC
jgi:hypothetical protein